MKKNAPPKILLVLVAGIGDVVLASKSFRSVRNGNPDAAIHLLVSSEALPIAKHYPWLNRVWSFPIRSLRGNGLRAAGEIIRLIPALRRQSFDSIVNLYQVSSRRGALLMGFLFLALGGRRRIGHDRHGFGRFLDRSVPADTFEKQHLADAMLDIARLAGGAADLGGTEISWSAGSQTAWENSVQRNSGEVLIGINPGGDRENRRWSPGSYADLADRLLERYRCRLFIFGGPGEEGLARAVLDRTAGPVVDLSGKLNLSDLAFVLSRLDLLVTNDSGPMHMAAAAGTPIVALYGPEDPAVTRPYLPDRMYRLLFKDISCRPCRKESCEDRRCLDLITPEEVFQACVDLIGQIDGEKKDRL